MTDILTIQIKVTERCNTKCLHCSNVYGQGIVELDMDKFKSFIANVRDYLFRKNWTGRFNILITGGEPLLASHKTLAEVSLICKHELSYFGPVMVTMQSNCLIYNDEVKQLLKKYYGNTIGASYSPCLRFLEPGEYELWEKNMAAMMADGIRTSVIITISQLYVDKYTPEDLVDFLMEKKFGSFSIEPITRMGRAKEIWDSAYIEPKAYEEWRLKFMKAFVDKKAYLVIPNNEILHMARLFVKNNAECVRANGDYERVIILNADGSIVSPNNEFIKSKASSVDKVDAVLDYLFNEKEASCSDCEVASYCSMNQNAAGLDGDRSLCNILKDVYSDDEKFRDCIDKLIVEVEC